MRLPLRYKIILPFFALLAFIGTFGTAAITARVTTTAVAEFDATLLRASLLAHDHLALVEAERLTQLRAAAETIGVDQAVTTGDRETLARLLIPIQANAQPTHLVIRALDGAGRELLGIQRSGQSGNGPPHAWSLLRRCLFGGGRPVGRE